MTVAVANNYNPRQRIPARHRIKIDKTIKSTLGQHKQHHLRKKIDDEEDDETMNALSSSKLNLPASIPIAPMSPQFPNIRSASVLSQQASQPSSSLRELKSSAQAKRAKYVSPTSSRRAQRTSMTTASIIHHHRHRQTNIDSSAANSSSTSPINLSRSTSPAASVANFIRPISPPCIQVKEPLSPKFSRASSAAITQHHTYNRHRSPPPPPSAVPPIANNVDASTASATTTLLIDDSSGYDSSENANHRTFATNATTGTASSIISTVPESCFEPETYRNLYPLTSSQQKKLSLSDPTLNQTTKLARRSQQTPQSQPPSAHSHVSATSLQRHNSNDDDDIHTDDEIDNLNSYEDTATKEKPATAAATTTTTSNSRSDSRKVSGLVGLGFR